MRKSILSLLITTVVALPIYSQAHLQISGGTDADSLGVEKAFVTDLYPMNLNMLEVS